MAEDSKQHEKRAMPSVRSVAPKAQRSAEPRRRPQFTYESTFPEEAELPSEDEEAEAPSETPSEEAAQEEPERAAKGPRKSVKKRQASNSSGKVKPVGKAEDPEAEEDTKPPVKTWVRIVRIVVLALVALLLVFIGYYVTDRWLIHDDAASLEGRWFVIDTTTPVNITQNEIKLNAETTYEYTIDTTAKTITYRFGDLEGQSHYRFTDNRRKLALIDGKDLSMWSTLFDDLGRDIHDLFDNLFNGGAKPPSGEGVIVLEKG